MWVFDGQTIPNIGLNAVAGRPKEEYGVNPTAFDEMRAGCYDVHERVKDMSAGGVLACMCFPSFPSFSGRLFLACDDKELALAVVQAYNDWHIDEWCGYVSRPLHPDGAAGAVGSRAERGRGAARRAEGLPLDHVHREPGDARAAQLPRRALGSAVARARGGRDDPQRAPRLVGPAHGHRARRADRRDDHAPADEHLPGRGRPRVVARVQGVPRPARRALSEGGTGWIPYFLDRLDRTYDMHHAWTGQDFGDRLPSDVFREHILTCFIADPIGLKLRDDIGIDNMCWEQDYPHSDSSWPTRTRGVRDRSPRSSACPTTR